MKRLVLYLISVALIISCGGGGSNGEDTPTGGSEFLNVNNVDITGEQTSATLSINASQNCSWTVSCGDSWISNISPSSGRGSGSVTITTTINPSSSTSRSATIRVSNSSGTIVRNVTLTQSASKEYLELSVSSMEFTSKAETRDVTISSNTHWVVSGGANWITLNKTEGDNNGTISVSIDENTSKDEREAVLTVTGSGGSSGKITIKQSGATYTTLSAPQVSDVAQTTAKVTFSFDSSTTVTSYGVCYSTTDNPTIENAINVSEVTTSNQGNPTLQLKDLSAGTTYYVRVYLVNLEGIKYSNSVSFTTATSWPGENDNNRPNI